MNKNQFIEKISIKYPISRIDIGINTIVKNFNSDYLKKIFDIFNFSNIIDKIYKIEDINLIYFLSEFQIYIVQIILNNPHLLNNYFHDKFEFYNLFNESTSYFILMKLKLRLFTVFKPNKIIIHKLNKYLGHIDKLFDFNIDEYHNFFQKNLDLNKKKEILLSIYYKSLKKVKRNMFILLWLIEEDIKYNIFDKFEDINDYNKLKKAEKISDIFLEDKILPDMIREIDLIQNNFKVIDNYKLFKENILSIL